MATIAMTPMSSNPYPQHQSTARTSRLSSLNPMRSSKQLPPPPPPSHTKPAFASPFPFPSGIDNDADNFQLTRVETNRSLDSNFSHHLHYKVTLNFSKNDIELIRYTWNQMLLEEAVVEKKSALPQMPGMFPIPVDSHGNRQNSHKALNFIKQSSTSNIASSLFCRQMYSNLLLMEPSLEKMFPSIKHQAAAFAGVMSLAMSQLENISNMDDYLMKLGKRHSRILCIEKPAFEIFGEALIQTFHERFGLRFNQELEILWIKLYMYIANTMLQFGADPKLRLMKNENDSGFTMANQLEVDEDMLSDTSSIMQETTRTTTHSTNTTANTEQIHGSNSSIFDRKASVSTQQTSIQNVPITESIMGGKKEEKKKKKLRTSIRDRTKEGCTIM